MVPTQPGSVKASATRTVHLVYRADARAALDIVAAYARLVPTIDRSRHPLTEGGKSDDCRLCARIEHPSTRGTDD